MASDWLDRFNAANDEAERRWGADALALEIAPGHFAVGEFFDPKRRIVHGEGRSWQEAFADADRKDTTR